MSASRESDFWSGINVVTDNAWGDTGKGKIVDVGAQHADMIIRYSGGSNAGHTVTNEHGEFKFHLIPSGIFNPEAISVMTGGVVINPIILAEEIKLLQEKGIEINPENLLISKDAHLVLPWHQTRDGLEEKQRGKRRKIGTTGHGIGPTYSDRAGRKGLRVSDLYYDNFDLLYNEEFEYQRKLIGAISGKRLKSQDDFAAQQTLANILDARKTLLPFINSVLPVIYDYELKGKNILGEGAQGALLDLDLGSYPHVTSSNPGLVGFLKSTGINHRHVDNVIAVTKAYSTRVGEGPLPTELQDDIGEQIREKGREYGTTTGRPRRCGWLDIPAIRYGCRVAQADSLAITKLDVLDEQPVIKICTGYEIFGKEYNTPPYAGALRHATPIFETMTGWQQDTTQCRHINDLPQRAKDYVLRIQELAQKPIVMVSVSPHREATIYC